MRKIYIPDDAQNKSKKVSRQFSNYTFPIKLFVPFLQLKLFRCNKIKRIFVVFSLLLIQIDSFRDEKVNLPFSIVIFSLVQGSLCHSLAALVLYQVMFSSFQVYVIKYLKV